MATKNETRLQWFAEARFGMFVHWGLYAITGRDMWYYSTEEVDKDHYERLFHRFDPVDYDPESDPGLNPTTKQKTNEKTTSTSNDSPPRYDRRSRYRRRRHDH